MRAALLSALARLRRRATSEDESLSRDATRARGRARANRRRKDDDDANEGDDDGQGEFVLGEGRRRRRRRMNEMNDDVDVDGNDGEGSVRERGGERARERDDSARRATEATGATASNATNAVEVSTSRTANDAIARTYVLDTYEAPKRKTEVAFESEQEFARRGVEAERAGRASGSKGKGVDGAMSDRYRGLRCTEDIERGGVILELDGAELITAQACARDRSLAELLRYWILVQTSSRVRTLVHKDKLRQWQRSGTLDINAPWARESDFEGEGYVTNPTQEQMHLPVDEMALSCFLALERRKGRDSKWYDYITKLPTLEDFKRDIPLLIPLRDFVQFFGYIECERSHTGKLLSDIDLRWMIALRRRSERALELTFRHIVSKVAFRPESWSNPFTYSRTHMSRDEFTWGYGVVLTRAFQASTLPSGDPWSDMLRRADFNGTFLAPHLDFANHKRPREVEYSTSNGMTGHGKIVVRALKNFYAGDYVHISYGAKNNLDLFMRYGFTVEDNFEPDGSSNDVFNVDLDDFNRFLRQTPSGTDVPGCGVEISIRFAQTNEYTYSSFDAMLDIARRFFSEGEPSLKAALEADVEVVRDDTIWDRDDDVYGNAQGDEDDEDDEDDGYDSDELADLHIDEVMWSKDGLLIADVDPGVSEENGMVPPKDAPELAASKLRVEIKALRALTDYMLHERSPTKEIANGRDHLYRFLRVFQESRVRTKDFYAMAAYLSSDDLAGGDEQSRKRNRRNLSQSLRDMLSRRANDESFHAAAKTLADAHVERVRLVRAPQHPPRRPAALARVPPSAS